MRRRGVDDDRSAEPFDLPGLTPAQACRVLIEHSALTWGELITLRAAAAGDDTLLDMTVEQAQGALSRWEGPYPPGLKLRRLAHWGTAMVRGGAPYDAAARSDLDARNPFADAEEIA